jgi:release factor glutamine methyltransferase
LPSHGGETARVSERDAIVDYIPVGVRRGSWRPVRASVVTLDGHEVSRAAELLRRTLDVSSLAQLLAVYGASDVRADAIRADLVTMSRSMADQLRLLVLGESLAIADAVRALGRDVIDALLDEEVLIRPEPRSVATPSLRLVEHWGSLLLCDQQSASATRYFGTDSTALGRVVLSRSGAWLDVCSGVGAQSMLALARSGAVVAVDINPDVGQLLEFNGRLNGFPVDRISFVCGRAEEVDLSPVQPADGFRTVTCNPPWMPLPESLRFALVGHGGADGLSVTRPVLERLPTLLHEDGAAVFVGLLMGNESGPFLELFDEIAQRVLLDIEVVATCMVPASSGLFFDQLVATASNFSGRQEAALREEVTEHFATMGSKCLFSGYIIARHTRGAPRVQSTALWKRAQSGWFV